MTRSSNEQLERFMDRLSARHRGETEFHQAAREVAASIFPYIAEKPEYQEMAIMERLTEPDLILVFRVCWADDEGRIHVQRGYRVQHSNAIGPYKGGLRFHPSVNLSILKFLAFEQTFKNSLTGLPMGAAKGGADFDPKGKSDAEVMRFCQSFMTELSKYIGVHRDVPAGDIGVGIREIGYMFGQHKRLSGEFRGILTGKGMEYGGSLIRPEATGYGTVYMMENMLKHGGEHIEGKTCLISGSGNVALNAARKLIKLGAKVVSMSDSSGFVFDERGLDREKLDFLYELKQVRRGRIVEYAQQFGVEFYPLARPWGVPCDLAFPCATQNEISANDACILLENGCIGVAEGANMPTVKEGVELFQAARIRYAPGKAANAGGVFVSGLEMSQNSARITWKAAEVDAMLRNIMMEIHESCVEYGADGSGYVDYVKGANIAGFIKVADAMLAYGVV